MVLAETFRGDWVDAPTCLYILPFIIRQDKPLWSAGNNPKWHHSPPWLFLLDLPAVNNTFPLCKAATLPPHMNPSWFLGGWNLVLLLSCLFAFLHHLSARNHLTLTICPALCAHPALGFSCTQEQLCRERLWDPPKLIWERKIWFAVSSFPSFPSSFALDLLSSSVTSLLSGQGTLPGIPCQPWIINTS